MLIVTSYLYLYLGSQSKHNAQVNISQIIDECSTFCTVQDSVHTIILFNYSKSINKMKTKQIYFICHIKRWKEVTL